MRRHALVTSPYECCNTIGGWYILAPILCLPFFKDVAYEAYISFMNMPYLVLLGLLKGVGFWGLIYCGQIMRRTSNSSAGFFGFICIGFIAIGNAIFGEELSLSQWVSVGSLFSIGIYFYFKGHLSTQTPYVKLLFLLQIMIGCMFGMSDHYFLTHGNWFGLIILTGIGMLFMALTFGGMSAKKIWNSVSDRKTAGLGAFLSMSEMIILSILVVYLPVTIGWVAMTLATVAVMVIAAVFWGEGRWQQQLMIGGASYAAVLPIILI